MSTALRGQKIALEDGVDIGYGVEKIVLHSCSGGEYLVPTRGITTLLLSAPALDEKMLEQLSELDFEFADKAVEGFEAVLVLSHGQEVPSGFGFFKFVIDDNDDYGIEFGVRIGSGELNGKLAKALFVIGRDHILFHKEICKNIEDEFTLDKLYFQLGRALNVYTGTGCH